MAEVAALVDAPVPMSVVIAFAVRTARATIFVVMGRWTVPIAECLGDEEGDGCYHAKYMMMVDMHEGIAGKETGRPKP